MRVDAMCKSLVVPTSIEGMIDALNDFYGKKVVLIGKGSNLIFTKEKYSEDYVFIATTFLCNIEMRGKKIAAQCGATMQSLSWFALEQSSTGFEFMEDIPGSVGGGIIMNAGTYKDTIGQVADSLLWYSPSKKERGSMKIQAENLEKRNIRLPEADAVILEVLFNTYPGNYNEILEKILLVKKDRYTKQPRNYPSAGSVFKRPVIDGELLPVWQLIEQAGLRGLSVGDAQVSEKHTGFIVNKGAATGEELCETAEYCKRKVKEKFGIELELEWKLI